MPKFVIIDQSIVGIGGHYYEYAKHVLEAAGAEGYETHLATNRKFKSTDLPNITVYPVYKYGFWYTPIRGNRDKILGNISSVAWRMIFLVKLRLAYSKLGFIWKAKNQMKKYIKWNLTSRQRTRSLVILALLGYLVGVCYYLAKVLIAFIPFKEYIGNILSQGRRFVKFLLKPLNYLLNPGRILREWVFDSVKGKQFGRDTGRLFKHLKLQAGDVVFIPTISEAEMVGLIPGFKKRSEYAVPSWHLLFRRNIYHGKEWDYRFQDEDLRPRKGAFNRFMSTCDVANISFYTDTEELTAQYNRLGAAHFKTLPIPHTFESGTDKPRDRPLNIIYTGDARTEKGYQLLPRVVSDLWEYDGVRKRAVRFTFQSNFNIPKGEPAPVIARYQLEALNSPRVTLIKNPLKSEEYKELVRSGDISLMMYDHNQYYARSSGILAESLGAGIPVIAPAGTWMSTQLWNSIRQHRFQVAKSSKVVNTVFAHNLSWRQKGDRTDMTFSSSSLSISSGAGELMTTIEVPKGVDGLFITFVAEYVPVKSHILVTIEQMALDSSIQSVNRSVVDCSASDPSCTVLVNIQPGTCKLQVRLRNAFSDYRIVIGKLAINFLELVQSNVPVSSVGMCYFDSNDISACVQEVIDNYDHYRKSALVFAESWLTMHSAPLLIKGIEQSQRDTTQLANGEEAL